MSASKRAHDISVYKCMRVADVGPCTCPCHGPVTQSTARQAGGECGGVQLYMLSLNEPVFNPHQLKTLMCMEWYDLKWKSKVRVVA